MFFAQPLLLGNQLLPLESLSSWAQLLQLCHQTHTNGPKKPLCDAEPSLLPSFLICIPMCRTLGNHPSSPACCHPKLLLHRGKEPGRSILCWAETIPAGWKRSGKTEGFLGAAIAFDREAGLWQREGGIPSRLERSLMIKPWKVAL